MNLTRFWRRIGKSRLNKIHFFVKTHKSTQIIGGSRPYLLIQCKVEAMTMLNGNVLAYWRIQGGANLPVKFLHFHILIPPSPAGVRRTCLINPGSTTADYLIQWQIDLGLQFLSLIPFITRWVDGCNIHRNRFERTCLLCSPFRNLDNSTM